MSTRRVYVRWILACAAAETVGMSASATAARFGQRVADDGGTTATWLALAVVVAGGLVEGTALGVLQARALAMQWRPLSQPRYAGVTVAVAGLAWAIGSAPGVLAGADDTSGPPLGLIVLGALGIGLVTGSLLGVVQALALRSVVSHPWRWVAANTAAWPLAMVVIFVGASTAGSAWSLPVLAGDGAVVGMLAGTVLGVVSGAWLGTIDGQPLANRVAMALVEARRLGADERLVGLAVTGRRTGRVLRFPVQYAALDDRLVVLPGDFRRKVWWRNLRRGETALEVLVDGQWRLATAHVLLPGDNGHSAALAAYRCRWPRFEARGGQPVVVLTVVESGIPTSWRPLESVRW